MGEALITWAGSVWTNFDEVRVEHRLFGYTNDTADIPCAWNGIRCYSNGTLFTVGLRYLPLNGEAPYPRTLHWMRFVPGPPEFSECL